MRGILPTPSTDQNGVFCLIGVCHTSTYFDEQADTS